MQKAPTSVSNPSYQPIYPPIEEQLQYGFGVLKWWGISYSFCPPYPIQKIKFPRRIGTY